MKILITGAGGLVGRALAEHCRLQGDEVFAYDHQSLDIADPQKVDALVSERRPDAVINCAAWTNVDACESDPEKARNVNALGPENLVRFIRRLCSSPPDPHEGHDDQNTCFAKFAIFKDSNWNCFGRGCRPRCFGSDLAYALC